METFFRYGDKEMSWLCNRDKKLAAVIKKVGKINRRINHDLFSSLAYSICGQQISMQAHKSIWNRVVEKCGLITPQSVHDIDIMQLQACGLSLKKAKYIKGIADAILTQELNLENLHLMSDKDVIKELTKLKGVGKWTAEMLMIFSMERLNIFSYKDISIIRGLKLLYHHQEISEDRFEKYRKRFSPYCTIASFYLWEIASGYVDLDNL